MNNNEKSVVTKYTKEGYAHVHCGAPDFIFYKVSDGDSLNNIDIDSVEFVEVKSKSDTLRHEQQIWKHILEKLGLKYKLEVVDGT